MAIRKNNKKVIGIYKGQSPVKKAYRGSSLMYEETPEEVLLYDVTATFNVTDTSTATQIYQGEVPASATTSSLTSMYIDGVEVTPTLTYTFPTTGEHKVGYNFVDNTTVCYRAFQSCSGMTSVKIRNNITTVGSYAFLACNGLTNVTIPDSVATISTGGFCDCANLTSVTIPDSVIEIGSYAFDACKQLSSFSIQSGSLGEHAFRNCSGLKTVKLGNGVTTIGNSAFNNCSSLTELVIPDSVTTIGTTTSTVLVNSGNTSLTAVTIGNGVTSLLDGALNSVPNLKYLKIGNGMTSLSATWGMGGYNPTSSGFFSTGAKSPFQGCTALEEVILPETLTEMSGPVFMYCDQLESITIPASVTALTDYDYSSGGSYGCFQNCTSLREVTFEGDTAPEIGEHTIPNDNAGTVYYPCGSDYSSVMNKLSMWTDECDEYEV